MNDEPKSIWKKSWTGRQGLLLWLISLTLLAFGFFLSICLVVGKTNPAGMAAVIAVGCALISASVFIFIRWVWCWRNFRRFLFSVACFITLAALFYVEEDWRGKHDWQKFKHDWESKGVQFRPASVIPAPVPDDQNFAMTTVFDAVNKLMDQKWRTQHTNPHMGKNGDQMEWDTNIVNRLEMAVSDNGENPTNGIGNWQKSILSDLESWQDYYRAMATQTNQFPIPPQPQTPAEDVLLALSRYDSTLEELRLASRLPYSRFPLSYDMQPPAAILLPHLAGLKHCDQVLQLRAIAELQNGQSDQALADVKLMLRLADSVHTEPILISHLVSIAIVNLALQPVWEGLAQHQWSDAQLAEFDSELAKRDFLSDYHVAMRGELMLCEIGDIEYLRRFPQRIPDLAGDGGDDYSAPALARIIWRLIPSGWFYQNELHCARPILEFYLPTADINRRLVRPADVQHADDTTLAGIKSPTPYNILARMFLPALGRAVEKFASAQESADLTRVAVALERYHLGHGEYPKSLDTLTPQFMGKIPHDIINGQPLHYRRTSDGQFVLYSVGWNETDDDGKVGLTKGGAVDRDKGDWVWRYPLK